MKIDLIFFFIIVIIIGYTFIIYKVETMINANKIEHMADLSEAQIAEAVKKYYLSDEFINNISQVSAQIKANGLIVPGNLNTKGAILFDGEIPHPDTGDGALYKSEGQFTIAADDWLLFRSSTTKQSKIVMNLNDGHIKAKEIFTEGNMNVGADLYVNSWIRVRGDQGIYFQDRGGGWHMSDNDWIRSYGNKNVYCNKEIRGNTMFAETDMTVSRNLKVGNTVFNENTIKRLIDYSRIAGWGENSDNTKTILYEGENSYSPNDKMYHIFVFRGWRVWVYENEIGGAQLVDVTNKDSFIPVYANVTDNKATTYKAEWVGY